MILGLSLLGPEGLPIAQKALYNFVERVARLYGEMPGESFGFTQLGEYAKHWVRWAGAGLMTVKKHGFLVSWQRTA